MRVKEFCRIFVCFILFQKVGDVAVGWCFFLTWEMEELSRLFFWGVMNLIN